MSDLTTGRLTEERPTEERPTEERPTELPTATARPNQYVDPDTYDFMSIRRHLSVYVICPLCGSENRHTYSGTFYNRRCDRCGGEYALEPFNTVIHRQYPSTKIEFEF